MEKEYILNLHYDIVQWQVWFMANSDQETKEKWNNACKKIPDIMKVSKDANDFFYNIINYFAENGFLHIQG